MQKAPAQTERDRRMAIIITAFEVCPPSQSKPGASPVSTNAHELTSGMDAMVAGGGDWRGNFSIVTTRSFDIRDDKCLAGWQWHTTVDLTRGKHQAPGLVQLGFVKSIKWGTAVGWKRGQGKRVSLERWLVSSVCHAYGNYRWATDW